MFTEFRNFSDDASEDPSRVKRRRVESDLSQRHTTVTSTSRSPLGLPDGDVVLQVEETSFKVHRARLAACSIVFRDMFELPQPKEVAEEEWMEGCPFVRVFDRVGDWVVVVRWLYEYDQFMNAPVLFDTIAGALRISTKYEMDALRTWAIAQLRTLWPSDPEKMTTAGLPHAAEAIALARECDLLTLLPTAFYALSIQRFHTSCDGGRSHLLLSPPDLRRLIVGRERLNNLRLQWLVSPLSDDQNQFCSTPCASVLARYWRDKLKPDPILPWDGWLLRDLVNMYHDHWALSHTLCTDCAGLHRDLVWDRKQSLKRSIPQFFML